MKIAGQEAQALAGFDRRTGEHDTADAVGLHRRDSGGYREISLAGTRWTERQGQRVGRHRLDESALVVALGPYRTPIALLAILTRRPVLPEPTMPERIPAAIEQ